MKKTRAQFKSSGPVMKVVTLDRDTGDFLVMFPYDSVLVDAVKALPSRKYEDNPTKRWRVFARWENIELLMELIAVYGFRTTADVIERAERLQQEYEANLAERRAADYTQIWG